MVELLLQGNSLKEIALLQARPYHRIIYRLNQLIARLGLANRQRFFAPDTSPQRYLCSFNLTP